MNHRGLDHTGVSPLRHIRQLDFTRTPTGMFHLTSVWWCTGHMTNHTNGRRVITRVYRYGLPFLSRENRLQYEVLFEHFLGLSVHLSRGLTDLRIGCCADILQQKIHQSGILLQ